MSEVNKIDEIVSLGKARKAAKERVAYHFISRGRVLNEAVFIGQAKKAIENLPEGAEIRVSGYQTYVKDKKERTVPFYTINKVMVNPDVLDYFDFD